MSVSSARRTWDEASSPAAVRLAREYEQAWRDSDPRRSRPDPGEFLGAVAVGVGVAVDEPGARLALLRADMALRWEAGEPVAAQWYFDRYADLSEDTLVALVYEEFCLREEDEGKADPVEYLARYARVAEPLRRVLEIHDLVGSGTTTAALSLAGKAAGGLSDGAFPEAGETIAGFFLVEELGRGAFARVFLAQEQQLADRLVALKVTRRRSREPQTLARLQHTHIVPVHSHRIDPATGLNLLCMPYFGRTTLAQVLADCRDHDDSGVALIEAIDRRESESSAGGVVSAGLRAGRAALERRSYARGIAWWGARLAEALEHAHDRGVLHRDIKPSNVLVTADGMPMLLDFNLAREPMAGDAPGDGDATLGGTLDYMAPEHLRALAENCPKGVDARSDLFSLGVVLYEAVTGHRPFAPPRRGSSVVEALLRAAAERDSTVPGPRAIAAEVPPALEAVIGRCLEPDPADRYATAAELAADLQAVADDLPLAYAREPWSCRVVGWFRRHRRRLAVVTVALLVSGTALAVTLVAMLGFLFERANYARLVEKEFDRGIASLYEGEYSTATKQFDATIDLADHFDRMDLRRFAPQSRSLPETVKALAAKLREVHVGPDIDHLRALATAKGHIAEMYAESRGHADRLFSAAERLRFLLLLGEGDELTEAIRQLRRVLEPFYVLESQDWTDSQKHTLTLLDPPRLERLMVEVNELLFLWMATIDQSVSARRPAGARPHRAPDRDGLAGAVAICDQALVFVQPREPWRALRARLEQCLLHPGEPPRNSLPFEGEPGRVGDERSALACFQWALLCIHADRPARAIEWMRQAVRLELNNYWYQYFLAYVEDQAGALDEALGHYSVAMALRPNNPWVRFSLARLYRSKGRWDRALEDMNAALDQLRGRPEARAVQLEMGYLYQELGDFVRARAEYDRVTTSNLTDGLARAARLNRANLDVESGAVERARAEYDELLRLEPEDTAARQTRALLELREGQGARAEDDLSLLLDRDLPVKHRGEILSARALARLLQGQPDEAVADAAAAREAHPCPAHQRLWYRALLAADRWDALRVDRPEALVRLPLGGSQLRGDLRAAADALAGEAAGTDLAAYRASLTRAVVLAVLGESEPAVSAASHALALSRFSAEAYLIRARVRAFTGDRRRARDDVDRGLAVSSHDPGLLELRGILRHGAGDPRGALADYQQAIAWGGAGEGIHLHKAAALVALGRDQAAVPEWSLALRSDPELPEGYLGRAEAHLRLRNWDLALADLEQAAIWAHADPRIELAVVAAYLPCVQERPDRLPRLLSLARRAAGDVLMALSPR